MVEAHCYAYNRGGINNQKIALFGLYLMSLHRKPHRLVLPDLCCFDQMGELERTREHYAVHSAAAEADLEERYMILYRIAQIEAQRGVPAPDVVASYLRAADLLPERAEAWHGACRHARSNAMYEEADRIAQRAAAIVAPSDGRFVERWIYDWALLDEQAVSASRCRRFVVAGPEVAAARAMLEARADDPAAPAPGTASRKVG